MGACGSDLTNSNDDIIKNRVKPLPLGRGGCQASRINAIARAAWRNFFQKKWVRAQFAAFLTLGCANALKRGASKCYG